MLSLYILNIGLQKIYLFAILDDIIVVTSVQWLTAIVIFQNGGHQSVRGNTFVSWMMKEPKFIVWLPTMYRMAASETGNR